MKRKKTARASRPGAAGDSRSSGMDGAPSADDVAKKAYFSCVSQGSPHGHDVRHWLEAERQLRAEASICREYGLY